MNALIRYPGAKWGLADWIISHFPPEYERMVYIEPFCGSGAVFFNKIPGKVETINDLDSNVVNLFRILREQPEALQRAIELTPYSREEYNQSFEPCDDPVEQARRYMVRTSQTIGAKYGKCGWRNHKQLKIGGTACKWGNIAEVIPIAAARLRGDATHLVQIEHRDALQLIERYNNKDVLMYLDPPYVKSTRKSGRLYEHEMNDEAQERLLSLIKNSEAHIAISGYPSELYDTALQGWHRATTWSQTTSTIMAQEVLWTNYEPPQRQIEWNL